MNIVCATDNNFVQHCAVTLISVLKNNPINVKIFLLTEGLTVQNATDLENLVTQNNGKFVIIKVDSKALKDCPMPDLSNLSHISLATYYRLLIPHLLPAEVEKVIYLDCDIVVRKSLKELWDTEIHNYAIGAVYQITERTVSDAKRLGYPPERGYFNAGVLLMNLSFWRDNNISEKLFEYLKVNRSSIIYHDQDALNGVLYDNCRNLPIKWNMLTIYFKKDTLRINDTNNEKVINDYNDYKSQILMEKEDPTTIHYVSKPKPWNNGCTHPYKSEYFKYLQCTKWRAYNNKSRLALLVDDPLTFFSIIKIRIKTLLFGNPYFNLTISKK